MPLDFGTKKEPQGNEPRFMVNINLTVIKSKDLEPNEKASLPIPQTVHILIREAGDTRSPKLVLVDQEVDVGLSSAGSVSYSLQTKEVFK